MDYPKEVYCKYISVTKENKRLYDLKEKRIEEEILKEYPNYYKLGLKERIQIMDKMKGSKKS